MSAKKIIIASATAFVVAGGAVLATNNNQPLEAESTLPIVEQVEEHEVRITDLEGRADSTEATVQEQGQQIQQVQRTVTNTVTVPAPAPTTAPFQSTEPTPTPAPAPAPQPTPQPPAPEPHPRTIIAVSVSPEPTIPDAHVCRYTLYSALETSKTGSYTQPNTMPCMSVGEVWKLVPESWQVYVVFNMEGMVRDLEYGGEMFTVEGRDGTVYAYWAR